MVQGTVRRVRTEREKKVAKGGENQKRGKCNYAEMKEKRGVFVVRCRDERLLPVTNT